MRHWWWGLIWLIIMVIGGALVVPVHATARVSSVTANQQLARELADHRAYANSDPGNYGYAKYIHQIKVAGHQRITVVVSRDFCQLSAADKTSVVDQVQALARMVLVDNHWISKNQAVRGLAVTTRYRGKVVGRSCPQDPYHYRW